MPEHIFVTFSWAEKRVTLKLAAHLDPQTVEAADRAVLLDTIKTIAELTENEIGAKLNIALKQLIVP